MAIALDTSTQGNQAGFSNFTYAHVCTGSNLVLVVGVQGDASVPSTVDNVTYNGVTLTQIDHASSGNADSWMGYLLNPATGSNTVSVTMTSGSGTAYATSASYTSAESITGVVDVSGKAASSTSSQGVTVVTTKDNDWLVGICAGDNSGVMSAGASTTQRQKHDGTRGMIFGDSNGAKSPAGSYALTFANTVSQNMAMIVVAIKTWVTVPVSVSDSSPVSDTPAIAQVYQLNKSDSSTISDSPSISRAYTFTTSDVSAISESNAFFFVWPNQSKHTSSWTMPTASTSAWTDLSKDTSVFVNQSKS